VAVPGNTFCSGTVEFFQTVSWSFRLVHLLAMGSPAPPWVSPLGLVPATVSSYCFPPSGLPVNIRHADGCPNSSAEFGNTLVKRVMLLSFTLVSEFELVVNSVLIGSGCTDCCVLRDDTVGLFARHL